MFIIYFQLCVKLLQVCTSWIVWKAYKHKVCAIMIAKSMAY